MYCNLKWQQWNVTDSYFGFYIMSNTFISPQIFVTFLKIFQVKMTKGNTLTIIFLIYLGYGII